MKPVRTFLLAALAAAGLLGAMPRSAHADGLSITFTSGHPPVVYATPSVQPVYYYRSYYPAYYYATPVPVQVVHPVVYRIPDYDGDREHSHRDHGHHYGYGHRDHDGDRD